MEFLLLVLGVCIGLFLLWVLINFLWSRSTQGKYYAYLTKMEKIRADRAKAEREKNAFGIWKADRDERELRKSRK